MITINYDMCNLSGKLSTVFLFFLTQGVIKAQDKNSKIFKDKTISLNDLSGIKEDRSDLYLYDINRGSRFHQVGFKVGVGGVDIGRVLAIGKGEALERDYFIMYVDNKIFYDYNFIDPVSVYDYMGRRGIKTEGEVREGRELYVKQYPKIVRIDIAVDGFETAKDSIDYANSVMKEVQKEKESEREAFRMLRRYQYVEDGIRTDTYYWGTPASKRVICIYDKSAHPEVKEYIGECLERVGGLVGWRVEFRFMDLDPGLYDIWNKCILNNIQGEYVDLRGNKNISDYMAGECKGLNLEKWRRDYISAMAYLKCWGINNQGVRSVLLNEIDVKVKKLRQRYGKQGLSFTQGEFEVALDKTAKK